MIDLRGKVALVTGGSRGIGRASALKLAEAGADIIVNYVSSQSAAEEVATAIDAMGRKVAIIKADMGEREDIESLIGCISEHWGQLDIIVNNAASGGFRPLVTMTDRNFEAAMNLNVRPLVFLVQSALAMLQRETGRAKVVSISSHGAFMALPMYGTIGASKAALESISRHLALELGEKGINFNVIRAGLVETDSTRNIPGSDEMFAGRRYKSMTGDRLLDADDVANSVLFLASPLSDLVQGEVITVDGGAGIHL